VRRTAVRTLRSLPLHAVVIGLCLLWILPALGLLVSSFRPPRDVTMSGWWTALRPPLEFTLANYRQVIGTYNMGRSFLNSLLITIPATIMPIMVAAYAAYAFAWMRFPGREALFALVVGALVIPLQMTLIPVLRLFMALHLVGTFPAVWLAHSAYGLPLAIYLLRNFVGALPRDLLESAVIDGAGPLTVFFRLILPLSVPAVASLAIFQFLWVWNDLLVALTFARETQPITVAIFSQMRQFSANIELIAPAAFVSLAIPLVVFFAFQRYFVQGLLAGSVK